MKCLFIDDNDRWLYSLERFFNQNHGVVFAECHSAKEALLAIEKHQPDIIFLDHSLTEGGSEGLEIVDKIGDRKIYSTTANHSVLSEYQKRNIECMGKTDLARLKSLIRGGEDETG